MDDKIRAILKEHARLKRNVEEVGDKDDLLALQRHGTATIVTAAAFAAELGT